MSKRKRGRPKGSTKQPKTKLITVVTRSLVTHSTKGTPMQFETRDQVKDYLMSIAYNQKPIEIKIF